MIRSILREREHGMARTSVLAKIGVGVVAGAVLVIGSTAAHAVTTTAATIVRRPKARPIRTPACPARPESRTIRRATERSAARTAQ